MIMSDYKSNRVRIVGQAPDLIIELQMVVDRLAGILGEHAKDEKHKEMTKTFILESVAFALCSEEEQKDLLESNPDDPFINFWKEGETK